MNQTIELSPLTDHQLELGRRVYEAIPRLLQIEEAYHQAGPQPSAEVALSLGLDSLKVAHGVFRAALWVEDRYRWERFGDDSIRKVLATAPTPSAIAVLMSELEEGKAGRIAPLLRHDAKELGKDPYHIIRRSIRAAAAAAVQALMDTKLTQDEAATKVADALQEGGFVNPGKEGPRYAEATIIDWRKRRRHLKDGFNDQYEEWLLNFRETIDRVNQSRQSGRTWTDEALQRAILFPLVKLPQAFGYRV